MIRAPRVPRATRSVLLAALVAGLLAFPMGIVLASHQFSDVPNSNPFHADIDALVDAGVTAGCGGGKYCPSANVTREQMAAFMNRLGALAPGKTPVVNADRIDGIDSSGLLKTGQIVTSIDGSGWEPHVISPTTSERYITNTQFSGDGYAVMPLVAPSRITSATYGLAALQICYSATTGGFINELYIYRTDASAVPAPVFADATDRTTSGCYTLAPNVAVGEGLGLVVGFGGGAGGGVAMFPVEATWSSSGTFSSEAAGPVNPALIGD